MNSEPSPAATSKNASSYGSQQLEQFVLLAKGTKGAGAAELIKQALDAPGLYVFSELIDAPTIQELAGTEFKSGWELLQIFAYGTLKDYKTKQASLGPLTPNQLKKLQHLTIISLSEQMKSIPYQTLLTELGIGNVRQLEDLIIEAIYAEIIHGKLDQKRALLEIDSTIGRDMRRENIGVITSTLESWCDACENVLTNIQAQVDKANNEKLEKIRKKELLDQEVNNLKKTVKTHPTQQEMADESMSIESREALGIDKTPTKKPGAKKSTRGKTPK
jgi:COP9 signalosome complex subunit 7